MLEKYIIQFGELEYRGFKFRKSGKHSDYPDDYLDKLMEEGSDLSKIKYLNILDEKSKEAIHIKLSYHYLLYFTSLTIFSLGFIILFQEYILLAIILLTVSGITGIAAWLFRHSAKNEYMSMLLNGLFVDIIFNEKYKQKEDKITEEKESV
ncbi:MAG TPA: hypothetical protein P5320_02255 [Bacteroidales bacterium]|nr:hypothetical protein [Bacteroidales bacterium]HRR15518.1 hypothetical protein [Bacteroidales bacterium]HRT46906.1 hypothetical protein [Bacteroidales bacterium]HRU55870.1 hypothetical protein [Bacteroidales bacterium]